MVCAPRYPATPAASISSHSRRSVPLCSGCCHHTAPRATACTTHGPSVGSAWHPVREAPQGMLPAPPTRRRDTLIYQTRCQKGVPGLLGCGRKVPCTQQSRVRWWPPPHTKRWLSAASHDPHARTTPQQTGMPACLQVPKICWCPILFCMKACRRAQGCWPHTMCHT